MFHLSLLNQIYPIIIQHEQPRSYAISLRTNQLQYQTPKAVPNNKKKSKSVKSISNSKQTEAQRTALRAGLQKSLDASNRGFNILKRMGYEEGKPLGKDGCGIIEPLTIPIKNNPHGRAGLGQEPKNMVVIKKEKIETEKKGKVKANTTKRQKLKSDRLIAVTKRGKRLLQLGAEYHDDIELLRLRLQAELSVKNRSRDTMIIAQVAIKGEPICKELFEIIHQYMVNSLHVYKETPFPMFHDITHVDNEIKVVCDDNASFEYLATCITALGSSLTTEMTTSRVSPVGSNVYYFAVQMEGLVCGPQSFLLQIKKHRFDLHPDRWIIVSQTPMAKANKTHLQIITDEHSAMLLIFRHNLKLLVCMQPMVFVLRGKIPFSN